MILEKSRLENVKKNGGNGGKKSISIMEDLIQRTNVCIVESPRNWELECVEEMFEDILVENFPKLVKEFKS